MITDEEYDELMKLFFSPDNTPKEQPKKNEEYKIYVAYGSNINTEQMMFRCPDAEIYATGMVQDYELSFNKVATLQKRKVKKPLPFSGSFILRMKDHLISLRAILTNTRK